MVGYSVEVGRVELDYILVSLSLLSNNSLFMLFEQHEY